MSKLNIEALKLVPVLDTDFVPAVKWNKAYRQLTEEVAGSHNLTLALKRTDTVSHYSTKILPHEGEYAKLNTFYIERILKFLLWGRGGNKIYVAGDDALVADLNALYKVGGEREFDFIYMGEKTYDLPFEIIATSFEDLPAENETSNPLGRNLEGNRIGFDLGGSDRKCAALVDGKVVFSKEVEWDPYFETNPQYHIDGINDTLRLAAEHLPEGRIDAIGGSAAGVYVDNKVRVASLFRGISEENFDKYVKNIFLDLKKEWKNVPFEVVNDGEVTALAGSMSMNENSVLGVSLGTSQAVGYVNEEGNIMPWLNELAFAPIDYRENAPIDEWSGDAGCGVQFFSQQGVARLAPKVGLEFPEDMGFPERLIKVQELMKAGDDRARKIYETIGVCFGYAIAHYAEFYDISKLLILGRVTSGEGGEIIIEKAGEVLKAEYPELAEKIEMTTPNEQDKRHGQAIAAASLPKLG